MEGLSFSYPAENGVIRSRIEFCIQHNTLDEQHNSGSDSGQDRLLEHPHETSFLELWTVYRSAIQLEMVPLDGESNSASGTTN
jgi:hypothetical protein